MEKENPLRMMLMRGVEKQHMTMVLAGALVQALIFLPVIGAASDSWQGPFGRRRLFIWVFSLGIISRAGAHARAAHLSSKPWLISALQAGAVCLTDFCARVSYTHSRLNLCTTLTLQSRCE
ncbi:hypothetical protein KUCAC02_031043 [Chaenocephalus aceratus]|uniref:Uncharacterized protein n=1 Tax=Chaenocephalus aceratus TaxID=36190 RepID=A0ACB9XKQ0_CHAAC|nr:hypothetical protein KUCAC02_031043 [Chaenocephalus aceratus]